MAGADKLCLVLIMVLLSTISWYFVSAADPDPLQDVCVADHHSPIKVNGYPCKPTFKASDFHSARLAKPGNTNNYLGSFVTGADVTIVPGLNTQGVAVARADFAPGGVNEPHTHPRATELFHCLYGTILAGFITTDNRFVHVSLKPGEIFVFPRGLVHFNMNIGKGPAAALAFFNSQLPGLQSIAPSLFNATPPVPDYALKKAFQISTEEVEKIKSKFAPQW